MRTLPATDYHDPAVHEQERRAIFGREWLCLGPSYPVAQTGSYFAATIAGWPIVVVRDASGELRAFHNVCRHRAGPLADPGAGSCRSLVCRYHGWTYELDGHLRSARDSGLDPSELSDIALIDAAAASWRGLLFVGIDRDLPPIEAWLGDGFIERCAGFAFDDWQPATRLTHGLGCNWKTYSDNYLEGYHIPFVHPALARSIDTTSYAVDVHDGWLEHSAKARDGATATGVWLYHWPNLALNLYEHGMSVERWLPTGPASCELVLDFCFADTGEAATVRNQLDVDASAVICEEDKAICEQVQRNLTVGAYRDGLLAPRHEAGVADFQRRVRAARELPC